MKHLGDITKINGAEVEPVDCLFGGSPCQDLSVAGLRKGLEGDRSGLFMEQVRVAKEIRENDRRRLQSGRADDPCRLRYFGWENVPGAFSSNSGKDFQAVLTEIIRIADPEAPDVPMPEKGWPYSGLLYDEMGRWSLAYRTVDAQWWGTPQRRKRIALLADLDGLTAGEILFGPQYRRNAENAESDQTVPDTGRESRQTLHAVSEGMCRDFESGSETREGTARDTEDSPGESDPPG